MLIKCPRCEKECESSLNTCPACGEDLSSRILPDDAPTLIKDNNYDQATQVQHSEQVAGQAGGISSLQLAAGEEIGKCRIEKELGRGGMGIVYLATHTTLDIPVAVKVLPPEIAQNNKRFAKRFLREAKLAAKIRHPNVMSVMDADRDDEHDLYYIVLEYVEGGSVLDMIKKNKIDIEKSLDIITGVAKALTAAGSANIVHRDIKPDNIMLTGDGSVKLADLGLAKEIGDDTGVTVLNAIVGTPAYMSPEQAQDTKNADHRSDIYSLGATFFYMLTRQMPFAGDTTINVLMSIVTDPTPSIKDVDDSIPDGIAALCMKMMDKDVDKRFQNAEELLAGIREFRSGDTPMEKPKKKKTLRQAVQLVEASESEAVNVEFQQEKTIAQEKQKRIVCAQCRETIPYAESLAGTTGHCPTCDAALSYPKVENKKPKPQPEKISFNCKKCKRKIRVSKKFIGKTIKCPDCGQKRTIKLKATDDDPLKIKVDMDAREKSKNSALLSETSDKARRVFLARMAKKKAPNEYFKAVLSDFQWILTELASLVIFIVGIPGAIGFVHFLSYYAVLHLAAGFEDNTYALAGVIAFATTLTCAALMSAFSSFLIQIIRTAAIGTNSAPVISDAPHKQNLAIIFSNYILYMGLGTWLVIQGYQDALLSGVEFELSGGMIFALLVGAILMPMALLLSSTITGASGLNPIMVVTTIARAPLQYAYFLVISISSLLLFFKIGTHLSGIGTEMLSQDDPNYIYGVPLFIFSKVVIAMPLMLCCRWLGKILLHCRDNIPCFETLTPTIIGHASKKGTFIPTLITYLALVMPFMFFYKEGMINIELRKGEIAVVNHLHKVHKMLVEIGSYPKDFEGLVKRIGSVRAVNKSKRNEERPFVVRAISRGHPKDFVWIYETSPTGEDGRTVALCLRGRVVTFDKELLDKVLALQVKWKEASTRALKDSIGEEHAGLISPLRYVSR